MALLLLFSHLITVADMKTKSGRYRSPAKASRFKAEPRPNILEIVELPSAQRQTRKQNSKKQRRHEEEFDGDASRVRIP
jgi:hypothetical protein